MSMSLFCIVCSTAHHPTNRHPRLHRLIVLTAIFVAQNPAEANDATATFPEGSADHLPFEKACEFYAPIIQADDASLQRLQADRRDGVALVASWEEVRRSRVLEIRSEAVPTRGWVPQEQLGRHLGFVEGRLQVSVPNAWENALFSTRVQIDSQGEVSFGFSLGISRIYDGWILPEGLGPFWLQQREHVVIPANPNVTSLDVLEGGDIVVTLEHGNSLHLRKELVSRIMDDRASPSYVCIEQHMNDWICGFVDGGGDTASVAVIGGGSMCIKWKRDLWRPTSGFAFRGSGWPHFIEFVFRDGSLFVFGAAHQALYIEQLDVETGQVQTRFGTYFCDRVANKALTPEGG